VTCPGGPQVKTYIGRKDSTTPAPNGLLPDVNAPAAVLFKLFQDKGFDAVDLAALLGAHTTSNQFNFNTSAEAVGLPQDSTPGVWDVKYYSETTKPPKGVVVFPSDVKLAAHPTVGKEFKGCKYPRIVELYVKHQTDSL
jgi:L-ascorbate peroxidase